MKILALDVGDKKTGLAISRSGIIANELETIENSSQEKVINRLSEVILSEQIDKIVVGLPKNMDGTNGEAANKTILFVKKLKENIKIPVLFEDERLTTQEAYRQLKNQKLNDEEIKKRIDQYSAKLILEQFLSEYKIK